MRRALLFDLDGTLVVEEPAVVAAFEATSRFAAARCGAQAPALALDARARARELWRAAPTHPYCRRVGISSWEGLWCHFAGEHPEVQALRAFAPRYRSEAWRLALLDQGVDDPSLARELGERFGAERRARQQAFADAEPALAELADSHVLALVTNGASCLQREKLDSSGLGAYFETVVVSGISEWASPIAPCSSLRCGALARCRACGDGRRQHRPGHRRSARRRPPGSLGEPDRAPPPRWAGRRDRDPRARRAACGPQPARCLSSGRRALQALSGQQLVRGGVEHGVGN